MVRVGWGITIGEYASCLPSTQQHTNRCNDPVHLEIAATPPPPTSTCSTYPRPVSTLTPSHTPAPAPTFSIRMLRGLTTAQLQHGAKTQLANFVTVTLLDSGKTLRTRPTHLHPFIGYMLQQQQQNARWIRDQRSIHSALDLALAVFKSSNTSTHARPL